MSEKKRVSYPFKVLCISLATLFQIAFSCQGEEIQRGVVMAGTRYETPYFIKKGAVPGPTVVVIGGVHGDEPAGYLAARRLVRWKIERGTLVIMPDAHREAIRRNERGYPGNMNRMFPGKANGDDMQRLAYEIWQVIREARPDLLLTLHESRDFHADNPSRYGQTFCFDFNELKPYMNRALRRVNADIETRKHKFLIFVDPFPTCPTYQTWSKLNTPATSIETSKTLPLKTRMKYQLMAVQAFFDEAGLEYTQDDVAPLSSASWPSQAALPSRDSAKSNTVESPTNRIKKNSTGAVTSPKNTQEKTKKSGNGTATKSAAVYGLPRTLAIGAGVLLLGWLAMRATFSKPKRRRR